MTGPALTSAISILCMLLVAVIGGLVRRSIRLQDAADEKRDATLTERHNTLQAAIAAQRTSLENEIRATRSDVRLVVGDVGKHGQLIAGAAASIEGVSGRVASAETEIRKLVREGCAHYVECRDSRKEP